MSIAFTKLLLAGHEQVLSGLFVILIVVALLLLIFSRRIMWFFQELKYLNDEIRRNDGREKERWKRRKRRLFLSIIPFVPYE